MGTDKRRAKREGLKRLLQESNEIYADEQAIPNSKYILLRSNKNLRVYKRNRKAYCYYY